MGVCDEEVTWRIEVWVGLIMRLKCRIRRNPSFREWQFTFIVVYFHSLDRRIALLDSNVSKLVKLKLYLIIKLKFPLIIRKHNYPNTETMNYPITNLWTNPIGSSIAPIQPWPIVSLHTHCRRGLNRVV